MNKKLLLWVAAGLAVLAIVGVGVFGVVSAQTPTQTPVPGQGNGAGFRGGMRGSEGKSGGMMQRFDDLTKAGGLRDEMLKAFADKLGLTVEDVTARIKAGETLAKIAESKGITADKLPAFMQEICTSVIDAAVKAGTLTQAQADAMKAKMQNDTDWTEMWGGRGMLGATPKLNQDGTQNFGGMMGKGGMMDKGGMMRGAEDGWMHDALVKAFADKLGLTVEDVTARLKAGETFAKIAESKGITGDAYTTLIKDLQTSVIDAAVKAGTLTQAQADAMKAMLDKAPGMLWDKGFGKGFGTDQGTTPQGMPFGGGRRGR